MSDERPKETRRDEIAAEIVANAERIHQEAEGEIPTTEPREPGAPMGGLIPALLDEVVDLRARVEQLERAESPEQTGRDWSKPIEKGEELEALRGLLKSAAAQSIPIVVAVSGDLGEADYQTVWPVPEGVVEPAELIRLPRETRAILAGSDSLAQLVRDEASSAGVRVLGD